jgi:hypothetical protein
MSSIIHQGQSFLDKVVERTGSIENAFAMALINGISVTDDVVIGQELKTSPVTNKMITGLFGDLNRPATKIAIVFETVLEDYSFPGEFPFSF